MSATKTVLFALLFGSAAVWGQSNAQINGTVRDSSGAAVTDASIKATQTATGAVRTVTSGTDGAYLFADLPIGPYLLEVTKEGFTKYAQTGIVLQVDSNPTIDVALKVGSVTEQVLVQADANMVETHTTSVGTVVDNQRVVEMPLNGRNATQLVFLAGMATIGGNNGGFLNSVRNYPTVMISVAG
ncbi:MAG TPA: carboxypeptidase-like regulatory domain-containing protein, partial [Bryobacteraceae bacterium]